MKEKIEQIRSILDKLEKGAVESDDQVFLHNYDALEIPEIVSAIVDFLQPDLTPYEAAIYWYLFRHSIIKNGQQYVRTSTRGMMKDVVGSSSGVSKDLSIQSVRRALQGLEKKGAILKSGDVNRAGTPYKVCLPEEIPSCQKRMKAAKAKSHKPIDTEKELDYYNVRENRMKIFERDDYKCHYCEKQLTRFSVTLDHLQPVSKGGDNSYDNLITACLHCNSRRGNRSVMDFLVENEDS